MSTGTLDSNFLANMLAAIAAAANAAGAATNSLLREWFLGDTRIWSGDPLDIDAIANAFARATSGDSYAAAMTSSTGAVGDAMAAKMQSDYLAAMERAFRMRHASPIRCVMHAASRRLGHGNAADGPIARVQTLAQDMLVAAAASPMT